MNIVIRSIIHKILISFLLVAYPIIGITELSEGIKSAPKSLAEVKEFKWYIFDNTHPSGSSSCEVETNEIIKLMVSKMSRLRAPKIEFNAEGGASDVFMFLININSIEVKNKLITCVFSVEAELAYYDKIGFIPNSNLTPFGTKYVLWNSPSHLDVLIGGDENLIGVSLGKEAARRVSIIFDDLIKRIHAANKYGYEYINFNTTVGK